MVWSLHMKWHRCLCIITMCGAFSLIYLILYTWQSLHVDVRQHQTKEEISGEVPIVGWPVNQSRDMRSYIRPDNVTALIPGPEQCTSKLYLLVVVCSAVDNFQTRVEIRESWASTQVIFKAKAKASVRVLFLVGEPNISTLQELVEEESQRHRDVIQEGFMDSYNNLTLKAVMMLKWVRAHCTQASFIMKTDDDMFVNVEKLVRLLQTTGGPGLLMGHLCPEVEPLTDLKVERYCPSYVFEETVYPNYLLGPGYVMAADVAGSLYQTALLTPFFHLEDVFLTGISASRAGIHPIGDPAFTRANCEMNLCLFCDRSPVTCHRVNFRQLKDLFVQAYNSEFDCADLNCPIQ